MRLWLTPAGQALRGQVVTEVRRLEMAVEGVLLRYISPAGLGALNAGLQALVAELPEGEDLLAAVSAEWDRRLERLRLLVEEENEGGGSKA